MFKQTHFFKYVLKVFTIQFDCDLITQWFLSIKINNQIPCLISSFKFSVRLFSKYVKKKNVFQLERTNLILKFVNTEDFVIVFDKRFNLYIVCSMTNGIFSVILTIFSIFTPFSNFKIILLFQLMLVFSLNNIKHLKYF